MKCVVWDLDGTLWAATAIELEGTGHSLPGLDPLALDAVIAVRKAGVVNALATRNPPSLADRLQAESWSCEFAHITASWTGKPATVGQISADLDIPSEEMAYVDNNAFERAAVAHALPAVSTMSVAQVRAWLDALDGACAVTTQEAASRTQMYRTQAVRRAAAEAWTGSHDAFLRTCEIVLAVSAARRRDLDRVDELVRRTNRYNSTGQRLDRDELQKWIDGPSHALLTGSLTDRFGEHGMVCVALVNARESWIVELIAISCRVAGRGCLPGFLAIVARMAASAGCSRVEIPLVPTERNAPMRVALRAIADVARPEADDRVVFELDAARASHRMPDWLTVQTA